MMGIRSHVPNTDLIAAARGQQLILIGAGDNVARLLPPLIVTEADVGEAIRRLDATCTAMEAELRAVSQRGAAE
jgi:acetylornithine/N-succinyldiaminopimelate aminotransferase